MRDWLCVVRSVAVLNQQYSSIFPLTSFYCVISIPAQVGSGTLRSCFHNCVHQYSSFWSHHRALFPPGRRSYLSDCDMAV